MDEYSVVILAAQIAALATVVTFILAYLACKAKRTPVIERPGQGRSILVTSVDTCLGLQLTLRLVNLGFRVFAGIKGNDPSEQEAGRVLKAKLKAMEAQDHSAPLGTLILVSLDVTREDSLHDAVDAVRRHLPVGENGLWAVINTSGVAVKGRLEVQESCQWESMFKINVIGTLRTARAFLPLLKPTRGRMLTLGLSGECRGSGTGAVAYAAARHAVVGASAALNHEVRHLGVNIVPIHTGNITADTLFRKIVIRPVEEEGLTMSEIYLRCCIDAVPVYALRVLEQALMDEVPHSSYSLAPPKGPTAWLNRCTVQFNSTGCKQPLLQAV